MNAIRVLSSSFLFTVVASLGVAEGLPPKLTRQTLLASRPCDLASDTLKQMLEDNKEFMGTLIPRKRDLLKQSIQILQQGRHDAPFKAVSVVLENVDKISATIEQKIQVKGGGDLMGVSPDLLRQLQGRGISLAQALQDSITQALKLSLVERGMTEAYLFETTGLIPNDSFYRAGYFREKAARCAFDVTEPREEIAVHWYTDKRLANLYADFENQMFQARMKECLDLRGLVPDILTDLDARPSTDDVAYALSLVAAGRADLNLVECASIFSEDRGECLSRSSAIATRADLVSKKLANKNGSLRKHLSAPNATRALVSQFVPLFDASLMCLQSKGAGIREAYLKWDDRVKFLNKGRGIEDTLLKGVEKIEKKRVQDAPRK